MTTKKKAYFYKGCKKQKDPGKAQSFLYMLEKDEINNSISYRTFYRTLYRTLGVYLLDFVQ